MNLEELRQHMDSRFDRLEDKVETFQDRITENTSDIGWIKGHLRVTVTIILAVAGFLSAAFFTKL